MVNKVVDLEAENQVKKRACERIPASLVVKFIHDDSLCYGIVTDMSDNGMCIKSGNCLPCDSKVTLQIPLKKGDLEIPVTVRRVVKSDGFYDIMGVELSKPTKRYLQIFNSFKVVF